MGITQRRRLRYNFVTMADNQTKELEIVGKRHSE